MGFNPGSIFGPGGEGFQRMNIACPHSVVEEALNNLESGLHKKRCLKEYDKVLEKIGRLKQQYSKAAKHYNIKTKANHIIKNSVILITL